MKSLIAAFGLLFLLAGCNSNPNSSFAGASQSTEPPIDFTYLGVSSDKQHIAFQIKVNTAKPIIQIDLDVKEIDDSGKDLLDRTLLWQSKDCCPRRPLEKGKIYDGFERLLRPGATKTACSVQRVHFQDGSSWTP